MKLTPTNPKKTQKTDNRICRIRTVKYQEIHVPISDLMLYDSNLGDDKEFTGKTTADLVKFFQEFIKSEYYDDIDTFIVEWCDGMPTDITDSTVDIELVTLPQAASGLNPKQIQAELNKVIETHALED